MAVIISNEGRSRASFLIAQILFFYTFLIRGPQNREITCLVIIKFRCDATSDCFPSPRSFTNLAITLTLILLD